MRVIITGATGFIGKALCRELHANGYEVIALTRNAEKGREVLGDSAVCVEWDARTPAGWQSYVEGAKAIINLAGANVGDRRWSEDYKKQILNSRLNAGQAVREAVRLATQKPEVLLQASASGFYGSRGDAILTEQSPKGDGFLAEVVKAWEDSVREVEDLGVRLAYLRTGVVLGRGEGMLDKLVLPFQMFVGGPPGDGKQWLSWIHIADAVALIRYLLETPDLHGRFNLTSPHPVQMAEFTRQLGKVLKRPSWLPVPAFAIKLLFQQMGEETVLASQRVLPERIAKTGFRFQFPDLLPALDDLLS
ncbi:MAG: TIGR01777 family oxidoreductase [Calditrichaeota bacterium]|nr:TIGR01777 family oxidoreductase [Calditrichota bacterium]MCB9087936.1 TIGR01777 family protein [Calditrichia bacterium]